MNRVVVDTDVLSFLFKNHPIGNRYDPDLIGRIPLISFMTVAELERWALQNRWNAQRLHWLHCTCEGLRLYRPVRTSAGSGPMLW